MILKSSNLLYLFDWDGTIAGNDNWHGFLRNAKLCFQQFHFNPSELDIRWCILTSRPIIDKWLIKLACKYHKLYPKQIIMGPTFTWKFKSTDQESKYKEEVIKNILDGKISISYTEFQITKICYIDNNENITIPLNRNRGDYQYIAVNVPDFLNKNLQQVLLI